MEGSAQPYLPLVPSATKPIAASALDRSTFTDRFDQISDRGTIETGIRERTKLRQSIGRLHFSMLCVLAFVTPLTFWPGHLGTSFPFYDVSIGLVFCLFTLSLILPRLALPKLSRRDKVLAAFIGWVLVNALTKGSWASAQPFIDLGALLFVISHSGLSRKQSKILVGTLLAAGFCVACLGVREYITKGRMPVAATMLAENTFSGYLSLLLPMSLFLWVSRARHARALGIVLTSMLAFGVALSSTRAGYITATVGMLLFAFIKDRRLIVLPFIYILVFGSVLDKARDRFYKISALANVAQPKPATASDASLAIRLRLWRFAWEEFKTAPLTGIGIGNFVPRLDEYRQQHPEDRGLPVTLEPHNTFMKVLCELGAPGLLLFLAFLTSWMWPPIRNLLGSCWTAANHWTVAATCGLLAFLAHNLTNTLFILIPCVFGFWVTLWFVWESYDHEARSEKPQQGNNGINYAV